jgi:cytochrome c556
MVRTVLPIAAMAIGISAVTGAVAQQDVIKARQDLMKRSGQQMATMNRMVRGQEPFDAAKVNAAFDAWADKAQKLPGAFPETTRTGETRALAKIWDDPQAFRAAIAKFQTDVQANRANATASPDGLKAAVGVILQDCNACHEGFRRPQS